MNDITPTHSVRCESTAEFPKKIVFIYLFIYLLWRCGPTQAIASSFLRFLDHTQRRITVGRTPPNA